MTRIVSEDSFEPAEYDATVEFQGFEEEDGSDETGYFVKVHDRYHKCVVVFHVVFAPEGEIRFGNGYREVPQ